MHLNCKGLTIRNATHDDALLLTQWWNDGKIMAHAGFPKGLGTTVERVKDQIGGDSDEKGRHLIIELNSEPIGEMCYRIKDEKTAEIGIKICDFSKQEQGFGRILLSMLIKELFAVGCETITLDTNLENKRAQHVYEKIGFRKIRVNTNSWKDQLGQSRSSVDYKMTKADFIDFTEFPEKKYMLGKTVTVTVDRPLGTYHPEHPDIYYTVNYGYVAGITAPDDEEQDAYVLGINKPIGKFTGKILAIIHRNDDIEEKWVVVPDEMTFTPKEIMETVYFQEKYFDSYILM